MADDTVQVRIEGADDSAPAISSAQAGFAAYTAAVVSGAAQITAATGAATAAIQAQATATQTAAAQAAANVGAAANAIQGHAAATANALSGLNAGLSAFASKFEEAFSAKALLSEMATNILSIVGPLAILEAGAEAVKEVFHEIVEFTKEATLHADAYRDLGLTLGIIEGGAQKGAEVYEFFESRLDHTRDTAHKLSDELIRLEPLLTARHFSTGQQEETVMQLSQLATIKPQMGDIDSLISGYQRILMGSASGGSTAGGGRNPLLKALGITPDQMSGDLDDTVQLVRTKLAEMTSHFDEFGDSVKSTMEKAKEALLVDFAEGFNGSRGSAVEGMAAIKAAVDDPEVKDAFRTLGTAASDAFALIAFAINNAKVAFMAFKGVAEAFGQGGWFDLLEAIPGTMHLAAMQLAQEAAAARTATTANDQLQRGREVSQAFGMPIGSQYGAGLLAGGVVHAEGFQYGKGADQGMDQLLRTIGQMSKTATREQLAEFFANVKDSVAHSDDRMTLSAADLISAAQDVFGSSKQKINTGAPGKGDDEIDTTAADTRLVMEQVRLLGEKAKYDEKAIDDQLHLNLLRDSGNKLAMEGDHYAAEADKERIHLTAEIASAYLRMQDDEDKGAKQDAANEQTNIDYMKARLAGLDATRDKLGALAAANYWKVLGDQQAAEINQADVSMEQFVNKSKEKLAEMPVAVADAARAAFAANQAAMDSNLRALFAVGDAGFITPETVKTMAHAIVEAGKEADNDALQTYEHIGKMQHDNLIRAEGRFTQQFSSDFAAIIESGGHNFAQIISGGFKQTVDESIATFTKNFFGTLGDPKQRDASGGAQLADHRYDQYGHDISLSFGGQAAPYVNAGVQAVQIGAAGYQAGQSGVPGSRTGAELGGAVAGAAAGAQLGTVLGPYGIAIGAVAGFAIAAISGAVGAQQRQADYKYGVPEVVGGVARFDQTHNYTGEAAMAVTRQIQQIYDSIHDSLVMVLVKAGALVPAMQDITGKFQPKASGPFEEHLQQYLSGGLQSATINQFQQELDKLAEGFGVSADRFSEIWVNLQNIDPSKVVTLFASLFDSLQGLSASANRVIKNADGSTSMPGGPENAYDVQHYSDPMTGFNPFSQIFGNIEHQALFSPGQAVGQQDKGILDLASAWKSFSPEGQITALAQVNTLVQQRYQTEIQLAQQLYALVKQIDASSDAASKNYAAMAVLKDDGTPDQYGLAQFYKKAADADLREGQNAKNADQLAIAYQKFQADVQAAVAAGYGNDSTKAGKQAWAQYGLDSTATGKAFFDSLAISLGGSINMEQAAFNAKFDPIIDEFKAGVAKMFPDQKIDPTTGKPFVPDPNDDPLVRANVKLTTTADAFSTALSGTNAPLQTFAGLIATINAALMNLQNATANSNTGAEEIAQAVIGFLRERNAA
jgi:hypothetical protein